MGLITFLKGWLLEYHRHKLLIRERWVNCSQRSRRTQPQQSCVSVLHKTRSECSGKFGSSQVFQRRGGIKTGERSQYSSPGLVERAAPSPEDLPLVPKVIISDFMMFWKLSIYRTLKRNSFYLCGCQGSWIFQMSLSNEWSCQYPRNRRDWWEIVIFKTHWSFQEKYRKFWNLFSGSVSCYGFRVIYSK